MAYKPKNKVAYCNHCRKGVISTSVSKKCKECDFWLYDPKYAQTDLFRPARRNISPKENSLLMSRGVTWCSACEVVKPLARFRVGCADRLVRNTCLSCTLERERKRAKSKEVIDKTCHRCGTLKPAGEFPPNKARPDGLHVYCRPCKGDFNRERRAKSPLVRFKANFKRRLGLVLQLRGVLKMGKTSDIVGCSYEELLAHLSGGEIFDSSLFHVDHICPLAQARTSEEIRKLMHYTNLQLLTASENCAKLDRRTPAGERLCKELLGREWIE